MRSCGVHRPRMLGNGIRKGLYQTHLGTDGSLSIQENTCERREHVSIITNTKTVMEDRRSGCGCANFDVGGGELEVRRNRKGIYVRLI